ncbi:MAG: hypothetical protein KAS51_07170 [Candidatus Omnitrophica bacterium]|nr:hypothetical protein [Candidatus Omnitrophota bacterium]
MKPYIKITINSYEEHHHLNLIVEASNGTTSGKLEYYCNVSDFVEISKVLIKFPSRTPGEYLYELGSEKPGDRFAFYFRLKSYTTDSVGHCAIQLKMNNNSDCPDEEMCKFSIPADVADINRLGKLIKKFSQLEHTCLLWSVKDGELK